MPANSYDLLYGQHIWLSKCHCFVQTGGAPAVAKGSHKKVATGILTIYLHTLETKILTSRPQITNIGTVVINKTKSNILTID